MVCFYSGREDNMYDVQEEVEGQNVNSHKFFPNPLIWVICILFGVYKFQNGSVRFLMHKYVSRGISRSQNKYISEKSGACRN
jgi:hypothetical protein